MQGNRLNDQCFHDLCYILSKIKNLEYLNLQYNFFNDHTTSGIVKEKLSINFNNNRIFKNKSNCKFEFMNVGSWSRVYLSGNKLTDAGMVFI